MLTPTMGVVPLETVPLMLGPLGLMVKLADPITLGLNPTPPAIALMVSAEVMRTGAVYCVPAVAPGVALGALPSMV
jgi:hypothetical protein